MIEHLVALSYLAFQDTRIPSEDLYPLVDDWARCGGIYDGAAHILAEMGLTDQSVVLNNTANGTEIAAAFALYANNTIPVFDNAINYTKGIIDAEKFNVIGRFNPNGSSESILEYTSELMGDVTECNEQYGDMQASLVSKARRFIYEQPAN